MVVTYLILSSFFAINSLFTDADEAAGPTSSSFKDDVSKYDFKLEACKVDLSGSVFKGPPGEKGPEGPHGPPGLPGSCWCRKPKPRYTPGDADDEGFEDGTESHPFESCKTVVEGLENGNYWISKSQPFQVHCDVEKNRTCLIPPKFELDNNKVGHGNRPFWLSEKSEAFNVFQFYNYTLEQIEWLWQSSTAVTQKIRYHCKNSYIIPEDDKKALSLLSWKETVIGPKPTERNPMFYRIINDGCKNFGESKSEWNFTDIELTSNTKNLPVLDFYIQDIRGEDQMLGVQLIELCFI